MLHGHMALQSIQVMFDSPKWESTLESAAVAAA